MIFSWPGKEGVITLDSPAGLGRAFHALKPQWKDKQQAQLSALSTCSKCLVAVGSPLPAWGGGAMRSKTGRCSYKVAAHPKPGLLAVLFIIW